MTPPLADELLEPALLPFGESTMLPAEAYTSPDVLAWERRHFFAGVLGLPGSGGGRVPRGRHPGGDDRR